MPVRLLVTAIFLAVVVTSEVAGQASGAARGSVAVTVVDSAGLPFAGALVVLDSGAPRQTGTNGRIAFREVFPGSRHVEVFAIGMRPHLTTVEVRAGELTETTVRFERLPTLPTVRVVASNWQRRMLNELPARVAKGYGQFRDSTQLGKRVVINSIFVGLRGVAPMTYAQRSGVITGIWFGVSSRLCLATVYIDGYREGSLVRLRSLLPRDIAVMEVYDRPELVPFHFTTPGSRCGVIAIWTKDVAR